MLTLDDRLEPPQRGALGLQALAPGRGRGALLGMAQQPPLDLGVALGQHPAALGQAGDPDLELLARARRERRGGPRVLPGRRASSSTADEAASCACSASAAAERAARAAAASAPWPRRARRPAGAAPRRALRVGRRRTRRAAAWRSAARSAAARASRGRGPARCGARPGRPGPARPRPPRPGAVLRPPRPRPR